MLGVFELLKSGAFLKEKLAFLERTLSLRVGPILKGGRMVTTG